MVPPRLGARPVTKDEVDREAERRRARLRERVDRDFTYHPPHGDQAERYETIRELARTLGHAIITMTPESREQSKALSSLEDVVYSANAAIARNEPEA